MRKNRRGPRQSNPASLADLDPDAFEMMDDVLTDFSVDELREFLEADLIDVPVDPEFKERLRRQLWDPRREPGHESRQQPRAEATPPLIARARPRGKRP